MALSPAVGSQWLFMFSRGKVLLCGLGCLNIQPQESAMPQCHPAPDTLLDHCEDPVERQVEGGRNLL